MGGERSSDKNHIISKCGTFARLGYGRLWVLVDFDDGLPTNCVEIVDYLIFSDAQGSGGRWSKSCRPDRRKNYEAAKSAKLTWRFFFSRAFLRDRRSSLGQSRAPESPSQCNIGLYLRNHWDCLSGPNNAGKMRIL